MSSNLGEHQRIYSRRHYVFLSHARTNFFPATKPQVIRLPAPSSLGPRLVRASGASLGTVIGSVLHDLKLTPSKIPWQQG